VGKEGETYIINPVDSGKKRLRRPCWAEKRKVKLEVNKGWVVENIFPILREKILTSKWTEG